MPRARRWLPLWLCALTVGGFLITLERVPIVWTDEVIYASIARAMQLRGDGVPTVLDGAPAIDHVGFYGPVYFALAAFMFEVFGFSPWAFRLLGVIGAVGAAVAGAGIAAALGRSRERQWWIAAAILLTPEAGYTATGGRMDMPALAWSLAAVALVVRGLASGRRPALTGVAAGVCFAAAALTAPRVYPLLGLAMAAAAMLTVAPGASGGSGRTLGVAVIATAGIILAAWGTLSHGTPVAWARFLWSIAAREDIEVAIATGATRRWSAAGWYVATSLGAAVAAGAAVAWRDRAANPRLRLATWFVLALSIANFAATLWVVNLTFALASYFAVGLLAAGLAALPDNAASRRLVAASFAILIGVFALIRIGRTVRVAADWEGRDPTPIARFVGAHVPRGSYVYGPDYFYLYAVEGAESRYLSASGQSGAGWARLVPQRVVAHELDPSRPRYVIWPVDEELVEPLPDALRCGGAQVIARFEPEGVGSTLARLSRPKGALPETYVASVLTRLPPGCGAPGT